jgi:putative phosphoesterase
LRALAGSDRIIHAGDIGGPEVLDDLRRIAPVTAVRGNNDRESWARVLPESMTLAVGGARIHVLHDVHELALDPSAAGVQAVVTGHSHQPRIEERDGVLFFNPGSAGPRRFRLPVAVGRLLVLEGRVRGRIILLPIGK